MNKSMKKQKVPVILLIMIMVSVILILAYNVCVYINANSKYTTTVNKILKSDKIEEEYARNQYSKAITQSELEYKLKTTAARLSLFMTTMIELDTENKVFIDSQFTNGLLYCDWVIYGDEMIDASNNLDGKLLIMNNIISTINTNIDSINVFIYSLGNTKISYEYIWKDLNSDIQELNTLIAEYNGYEKVSSQSKFITISEIKNIYPDMPLEERNRIKNLFN